MRNGFDPIEPTTSEVTGADINLEHRFYHSVTLTAAPRCEIYAWRVFAGNGDCSANDVVSVLLHPIIRVARPENWKLVWRYWSVSPPLGSRRDDVTSYRPIRRLYNMHLTLDDKWVGEDRWRLKKISWTSVLLLAQLCPRWLLCQVSGNVSDKCVLTAGFPGQSSICIQLVILGEEIF
jgi:hypothetical protein